MDGIELTFAILGGAGLALLVLSFALGELFEFGDHGVEVSGDADHGSFSWFSTKLLAAGMVGLGGFGYLAASYGAATFLAWLIAIVGFIVVAVAAQFGVLGPMSRQQANSLINRESYKGHEGTVHLAIPATGMGQIVFRDPNGARTVVAAVSSDQQAIPFGAPVYIVDVRSDCVVVMPSVLPELPKE